MDTEEAPISSDEEDSPSGHPIEDKVTVLENLRNGFKYHKNGPAQPYEWDKKDMSVMTEMIKKQAASLTKGRRKVRAVGYDNVPLPDGLLGWVNSVRDGTYFSDNPNVERGPRFKSCEKSNFWLWNFVSRTLLAEFDYWTEVHKENKNCDPSKSRYPKLSQLIFRHPDDFVGGLWSDFQTHWQRFIDEMR